MDPINGQRYAHAYCQDYDLHGIVGIRLIGPSAGDAARVSCQLGAIQSRLERTPDICIHFVDRIPFSGPLYRLGGGETGYSDNAFFIFTSKRGAPCWVQIDFRQLGSRCDIVCQSGLPAVPYLIPIVNLTALANGFLPLHASALIFNGVGALVSGWSKGGKTEVLLAFAQHGATYVGDEWIYIDPQGTTVYGIPEPITVWDWYLRQLPHLRRLLSWKKRAQLRAMALVHQAIGRWARRLGPARRDAADMLRKAAVLIQRQRFANIPPEQAFPRQQMACQAPLHKLLFVGTHDAQDTVVHPIDARQVAERMVFSLQEERRELLSCYRQFRFAFPQRANALLDTVHRLERQRLVQLLGGIEAYSVYHPYPASIPALFAALEPLFPPSSGRSPTAHSSEPVTQQSRISIPGVMWA